MTGDAPAPAADAPIAGEAKAAEADDEEEGTLPPSPGGGGGGGGGLAEEEDDADADDDVRATGRVDRDGDDDGADRAGGGGEETTEEEEDAAASAAAAAERGGGGGTEEEEEDPERSTAAPAPPPPSPPAPSLAAYCPVSEASAARSGRPLPRYDSGIFDPFDDDDDDDIEEVDEEEEEEDDEGGGAGDDSSGFGGDASSGASGAGLGLGAGPNISAGAAGLDDDDEGGPLRVPDWPLLSSPSPLPRDDDFASSLPSTHRPFAASAHARSAEARRESRAISATPAAPTRQLYNHLSRPSSLPLSSLPSDALHAVATYCDPIDWGNVTRTSATWRNTGREAFRRVWRHAGRCAAEVGTAWARGERADARELLALYVRAGVPVYPAPLGHAYHTVSWRMDLEQVRGDEDGSEGGGGGEGMAGGEGGNGGAEVGRGGGAAVGGTNDDDNNLHADDPFYAERYLDGAAADGGGGAMGPGGMGGGGGGGGGPPRGPRNAAADAFRPRPFSSPRGRRSTYVEEKALYWKRKKGIEDDPLGSPSFSPPPGGGGGGGIGGRRFSFHDRPAARGPPADPLLAGGVAAGRRAAPQAAPGAARGSAAGGVSLARPPPLPSSSLSASGASTAPFGAAAGARSSAGFGPSPSESSPGRSPRFVRRNSLGGAPSPSLGHGASSPALGRVAAAAASPGANAEWDDLAAAAPPSAPPPARMTMRVHRHLVDQHLFGCPAVDDEGGAMTSGRVSMGADFFHPSWERRQGGGVGSRAVGGGPGDISNSDFSNWRTADSDEIGETFDRAVEQAMLRRNPRMEDANYRAAIRAFVSWTLANSDRSAEGDGDVRGAGDGGGAGLGRGPTAAAGGGDGRRNSLPANPDSSNRLRDLLGNSRAWTSLFGDSPNAPSARPPTQSSSPELSPAADVRLDVYSCSSASAGMPKSDDEDNGRAASEAAAVARVRALASRLDALLADDAATFDDFREALLDFWDELWPSTAGMHYHNRQSPVPRMSRLHEFLTTPCPKAVGTVQCEIERVRVRSSSNKKNGLRQSAKGVRGRLFPTYEYRLFVRDSRNDRQRQFVAGRPPLPRKDAVLLVAKTKGGSKGRGGGGNGGASADTAPERRGSGVGGFGASAELTSPSNNSRRGVSNYYLRLPSRRDVDAHYQSANRQNEAAQLKPGETSGLAVSRHATREVGRLQGNFIGTEFQIFVPPRDAVQNNDEGGARGLAADATTEAGSNDGDGRVHPTDAAPSAAAQAAGGGAARRASRRSSGLARLARKASMSLSRRGSTGGRRGGGDDVGGEGEVRGDASEGERRQQRRESSKKVKRRMSWGNPASSAASRADDADVLYDAAGGVLSALENGAITYTANLLGNRPRIMDVCLPKLREDGTPRDDWRMGNTTGSGADSAATSMLERFKSIQQNLESLEDHLGNLNDHARADDDAASVDHDAPDSPRRGLLVLQNRPPWWNVELGAFVLNFGGRVKVASVKNFQLCERNDRDHVMQFGRIEGRHAFTMDFGHPLTPVQAFAIAISSLQSKISFG